MPMDELSLDFAVLDDLALGVERARLDVSDLGTITARRHGSNHRNSLHIVQLERSVLGSP